MPLQPGERIPDVTLVSHTNAYVALRDFIGRPLVVHFFPLAFTSTCTEQLCTVRERFASYRDADAAVVAVSVDSPFVLARFRTECEAEYPFLSDFNRTASEAFGVLRTAPVGPGLVGVSDRAVFVADAGGTIVYSWHSTNTGVLPPFAEIDAAIARAAG